MYTPHRWSPDQRPPLAAGTPSESLVRLAVPTAPPPLSSPLRVALAASTYLSDALLAVASLVGGVDALESLTSTPISAVAAPAPDVPAWLAAAGVHLVAVPRWLFDPEREAISDRIVAHLARGTDAGLARLPPDRLAAGIVWLVLAGNGDVGRRRGQLPATTLWRLLGVKDSSRHGRLAWQALGLAPVAEGAMFRIGGRADGLWLTDPELLTGRARQRICSARDSYVRAALLDLEREADEAPIRRIDDRLVRIRAVPTTATWASRTTIDDERQLLLLAVEHGPDHPEVLALSIPDAHHLVHLVQAALAGPCARHVSVVPMDATPP